MKKLTEAWAFATLQELRTLYLHLKQHGRTMREFVSYVDKAEQVTAVVKRCPQCNRVMDLYNVNSTPRDQVGGNWKSQWFCSHCGNSMYSENTPAVEWDLVQRSR